MFWKFNSGASQHIETLLNKEDVSLQELLDEEDILQECKVQNKKLIDFLIRPEILEELVTLITTEPSSEEDYIKYKYPNLSCELLTCDVPLLNEKLASDENLLSKLCGFLENEAPLNPLLASFFSRTMAILITRRSEQNWYSYQFTCLQVLEYLKGKEEFVNQLIRHLGTSAIMDLLYKLMTGIEGPEMKQNVLAWLDGQQLMPKLLGLASPKVDEDIQTNGAFLLCEVIAVARDNTFGSQEKLKTDPLVTTLESTEAITDLLNTMFAGECSEGSLVTGISIVLALLQVRRVNDPLDRPFLSLDSNPDLCNSFGMQDPAEMEKYPGIQNALTAIVPQLKHFHDILINPPVRPYLKTTVGMLDPPLGKARLEVARLIAGLIATNNPDVLAKLQELDTLGILLDLFFKYSWNNFFHTLVEECIDLLLSTESSKSEENEETVEKSENSLSANPLLVHIFKHCNLIQRILDGWEDNDQEICMENGHRKGYMGHLTKIANYVMEVAKNSKVVQNFLNELPEETREKWSTFVGEALAEINKKNSIALGGTLPHLNNPEQEDADFRDIPFPQDTAFQQIQQMTPQLIEHFSFNDDEFNDAEDALNTPIDRLTSISFNLNSQEDQRPSFETLCNQRTQTQDDSDDDVWEDKELNFDAVMDSHNRKPKVVGPSPNSLESPVVGSEENGDVKEKEQSPPLEVKMEVDPSDNWANFENTQMDTTWPPAENNVDVGWADFNKASFMFEKPDAEMTDVTTSRKQLDSGDQLATKDLPLDSSSPPPLPSTSPPHENASGDAFDFPPLKDICIPLLADIPPSPGNEDDQLADNFKFLSNRGLLKKEGEIEEQIIEHITREPIQTKLAEECSGNDENVTKTDEENEKRSEEQVTEGHEKTFDEATSAVENGPIPVEKASEEGLKENTIEKCVDNDIIPSAVQNGPV